MVKEILTDLKGLWEVLAGSRILCFGAGIQGKRWASMIADMGYGENLIGFIDNSVGDEPRLLSENGRDYPVMSAAASLELCGADTVIFITSIHYESILKQLDGFKQELRCVTADKVAKAQLLISDYPGLVRESESPLIPKVIHYAWFGAEMPEDMRRIVEGWKRLCPDYEFKLWNEKNYDVTKNRYMREAYEKKAWGFVPDYLRLDVICREGGIYLDTDIELLKRPDELLYQRCFSCTDATMVMNLGSGFGAEPGHPMIREIRDYYDDRPFIKPDGSIDKTSCNSHNYRVIRKYGYRIDDGLQEIGGMQVYPMIFQGVCQHTRTKHITDKTFWAHYGNLSWFR